MKVVIATVLAATVAAVAGSPLAAAGPGAPARLDYTVVWSLPMPGVNCLGVTPVQDTLMWVATWCNYTGDSSNAILVFDLRTRQKIDSFQQPAQDVFGYPDLTYDARTNRVYGTVTETDSFDVIDATTHALVGRRQITGPQSTNVPGGIGTDGESLYISTLPEWPYGPILKLAFDGSNCHTVGTELHSAYGLGIDRTHGLAYLSELVSAGSGIQMYRFPEFSFLDYQFLPEATVMCGCETWRDSLLLVVEQDTFLPDSILCLRMTVPTLVDAGLTDIIAPDTALQCRTLYPRVRVRNFGQRALCDFPVWCWVDSAGVRVYDDTARRGLLLPESSATFAMNDLWRPGRNGVYDIVFVTGAPSDSNPANDTIRRSVRVYGIGEESGPPLSSEWMTVAPNPFRDRFLVACGRYGAAGLAVDVFDAAGNRLQHHEGSGRDLAVRLAGSTPAAVYFVRVTADGRSEMRKVVRLE